MRRAPLLLSFGGAVMAGGSWLFGLRFNFTSSLPRGVYAVTQEVPGRGAIVLACLPPAVAAFARGRGYVPRGGCAGETAPVGKLVLALHGDVVTVSAEGLSVNGAMVPDSRPRLLDREGRPLPSAPVGQYTVAPGEL